MFPDYSSLKLFLLFSSLVIDNLEKKKKDQLYFCNLNLLTQSLDHVARWIIG